MFWDQEGRRHHSSAERRRLKGIPLGLFAPMGLLIHLLHRGIPREIYTRQAMDSV
jgi:hypothetical protein